MNGMASLLIRVLAGCAGTIILVALFYRQLGFRFPAFITPDSIELLAAVALGAAVLLFGPSFGNRMSTRSTLVEKDHLAAFSRKSLIVGIAICVTAIIAFLSIAMAYAYISSSTPNLNEGFMVVVKWLAVAALTVGLFIISNAFFGRPKK